MPSWDNIEDASPSPSKLWLAREGADGLWMPLRKADCIALNAADPGEKVAIESGRATADLTVNEVRYNFFKGPPRQIKSAIWFQQGGKKDPNSFYPLSPTDEEKVEQLYQKALNATSSLGEGIASILGKEVALDDDKYIAVVTRTGVRHIAIKKRRKKTSVISFGSDVVLQRGYGEYIVDGEQEELALGPVRSLVFVVHGIGGARWGRSFCAEMDQLRTSVNKAQFDEWQAECKKRKRFQLSAPKAPNRVEILPVEWFDSVRSQSSVLMDSLGATTLRSIPALRAIANDVVFDVLLYMTPEFCKTTLECVTKQINETFDSFRKIHCDFLAEGGSCSLIGHSLGSVIVWDLLSILKEDNRNRKKEENSDTKDPFSSVCGYSLMSTDTQSALPYQLYAMQDGHNGSKAKGTWGPSLKSCISQTLPFAPRFTFFLGSPLGLFLALRGAQYVFNKPEQSESSKVPFDDLCGEAAVPPVSASITSAFLRKTPSPFTLPSGAIKNIFHLNDPIAYRIEPLLLPHDMIASDLPAPSAFGTGSPEKEKKINFPLGGRSTRVDFQLRAGVVENEYLSSISAHSSYFTNDDVISFIVQSAGVTQWDTPGGIEKNMDCLVVPCSCPLGQRIMKSLDRVFRDPSDLRHRW